MSLIIADNFSYQARKPLDNRLVVSSITDLTSMSEATVYDGIIVYVLSDKLYFTYNSANTNEPVLGKWREFTGSSSAGAGTLITEYQPDTAYEKDTLLYCGDKLAKVLVSYTSSNIDPTDTQKCFEEDIKNNNVYIFNNCSEVIAPYMQGSTYYKDHLVYMDDFICRVIQDFVADNTAGNTMQDSFDTDIAAGNITILNKEADHIIKPYKQGELYEAGMLVYDGKLIARVINAYISDNTAPDTETSMNIDISNGNLITMGEEYKFKVYKTTFKMDNTIDAITTIPDSMIVFENGETIANMETGEAVYDSASTLAIIQSIDINNSTVDVKAINSRYSTAMPEAPATYNFTINLAGTGFTVGEIIPTDMPGVNAEVAAVGSSGEILAVHPTNETLTNANGMGQDVSAALVLYVANGQQWFEMPEHVDVDHVKEYAQGEFFPKGILVYLGSVLYVTTTDFNSDASLSTIDDSLNFDVLSGNLLRMTREDVNVPECLGSIKTDDASDFPSGAIKGNWVLVENCKNNAPGQAGIGLYNGTSWDISPIPQGTFTFPEPNQDGKLYFRKRDVGLTDGDWEAFSKVDGNDIEITVKTKSDLTDNSYVPKANELVWDTNRKILVIGDGSTSLGSLKEFYGTGITSADILSAIGYTPENAANKGQANGYAPLDASGKVPVGNLPASLVDTYSKTEIDTKDTAIQTSLITLINTEASRATTAEGGLRTDLTAHVTDNSKHVTQSEKDAWDAKVDPSDLTAYDNHLLDTTIHVTQADKDKWNGMNKAYYVTSVSSLPTTGNTVGNMGYVQTSVAASGEVVCDQYLWDGSAWRKLDANQVSLSFTWGNLTGKPASTPLAIDNTVTVAHNHNNKTVLDKIGLTAGGSFTYDGVEVGVKAIFLDNENLLPTIGEAETLYVIYEDARVRNYPSISVWRDGSYQMLGRGIQESAPVVGDMNILQSEYYSVVAGATYRITVTLNQYFAFMPVEILREIEGATNQTKVVSDVNDPTQWAYNDKLLSVTPSSKCTISIQELDTELDTVSDYYYSHIDVDLTNYKDIDNIG